jgi:exopolyphosphatase/guanosine-5'-triphosphate,3'-diphosphate pyrophosphatase
MGAASYRHRAGASMPAGGAPTSPPARLQGGATAVGHNVSMAHEDSHSGVALAAVDIGSNSFRLEIAQVSEGRYRRIDYLKEAVRLGAGLDSNGFLTDEAAERGLTCLRGFASRLSGIPAARVRAVATQTLREARNRDAFLVRAQAALGYPVEVISGREEARLIYAGVARLQPSKEPRLVIDIGGRSTEMIVGAGRTPQVAESFGVGCVSLSMRYFGDGRLSAEAFRAAQVAAGAEFEEAIEAFSPAQWQEALGSSGTAGAISQVLQAAGVTDGTITPAALQWCISRCIEAGRLDRLKLPALKADRVPVIAGGLSILYSLAVQFGIERLSPARGALRQGVIFELSERLNARARPGATDLRDGSAAELQRRFGADLAHAQRVRRMALSLFDQARPNADAAQRLELGWACALHEIGLMVSHHDHHRHSAYLVANADAAGFSQSLQRRLSELVLGQRGGLRKLEVALSGDGFAWQLLCLRLAIIKCHARDGVDDDALTLSARGTTAQLGYDAAWAKTRPRTVYLLREESDTWRRAGPLQLALPG